jgi:hypothetical protein
MKYETHAGLPTEGLTYAKLLEHLREAQECAAMMAHLRQAQGTLADTAIANGWLAVSEQLRRMAFVITQLATKGRQ